MKILKGTKIGPEGITMCRKLSQLVELYVEGENDIGKQAVHELAAFPSLRHLELFDCNADAEDVQVLLDRLSRLTLLRIKTNIVLEANTRIKLCSSRPFPVWIKDATNKPFCLSMLF